jgi:putative endonuclease
MAIVYIIKSEEGYVYTGCTEDLSRRLKEHNNKSLSFWTKRGNNWKLVYKEVIDNKTDAIKREKWLKSGKGREFIKNILNKESEGSGFNSPTAN